jgi:hypothetical protein
MMTIRSDIDDYYEVSSSSGYHLVVLGEIGEQWTDGVLGMCEQGGKDVDFFPWFSHRELRLQLEAVYYPLTQLWWNGSLKAEFTGYHNESIMEILEQIK